LFFNTSLFTQIVKLSLKTHISKKGYMSHVTRQGSDAQNHLSNVKQTKILLKNLIPPEKNY